MAHVILEYKQTQTLDSWLSSVLMNIGPAKSTPVWVKGGASLTRNGGKGVVLDHCKKGLQIGNR